MKNTIIRIFLGMLIFGLIPLIGEFTYLKVSSPDHFINFHNLEIVDYNNNTFTLYFNRTVTRDINELALSRRIYIINEQDQQTLFQSANLDTQLELGTKDFLFDLTLDEVPPGTYYIQFSYVMDFQYDIRKQLVVRTNNYLVS